MPTDGDDTASLIVGDRLLSDLGERHAVETLLVAHLNTTKLKAHDGWIVATYILDVAGVLLVFPRQAIERVVLMSVHDTFLPKGVQTLYQLLCPGLGGLCFLCRRTGYYCHRR